MSSFLAMERGWKRLRMVKFLALVALSQGTQAEFGDFHTMHRLARAHDLLPDPGPVEAACAQRPRVVLRPLPLAAHFTMSARGNVRAPG